jgi:hypothetical protein
LEFFIKHEFLLLRIIEDKYDARLSNKRGYFIEDEVIGKIFHKKKLTYEKGKIDDLQNYYPRTSKNRNPNIDLIYPSKSNPKICIECTYQLTTASGQTKKIDSNNQLYKALKNYSKEKRHEITFINFIDGAGWIARGLSDLKRFYENCDYIINYNTISELEDIIDYYKLRQIDDFI